ncbi:uncharacterized protein LOC122511276 [Leptopilina heterotoma]|uniref:uncharacterized protein LOC122511276 n=1 Tax=Leptopilina heterotoma TaxID=63436 RepID=UPI001CA91D18|nr:uncharacterized protein LOC122511276 [Leptopilina heterotoma]
MAPRGKKLFALIWWKNTSLRDVIPLTTFPKEKRNLHSVAEIPWKNFTTKEVKYCEAKILAIDQDASVLDKLVVTASGDIVQPSNKIFSEEVIEDKKILNKQKVFQNNIKKSNIRHMNEIIKKKRPLFAPPLKRQKVDHSTDGKIQFTPHCNIFPDST